MKLNTEQKAAVNQTGSVMVIAGPGTGKTRLLVAKASQLLRHQPEKRLLLLTFTNQAAWQMQQRLQTVMPESAILPQCMTFHAWAYWVVRQTESHWQLITPQQQLELIQSAASLPGRPEQVISWISQAKQGLAVPDSVINWLPQYQQLMATEHYLDFDDLLIKAGQLIGQLTADLWPDHVLVDELQDLNQLQFDLLDRLKQQKPEIEVFAVGDPRQAIYQFRGASPRAFDRLSQIFPQIKTCYLTRNYRSGQAIIQACQQVMPTQPALQSASDQPSTIYWRQTASPYQQASLVIKQIKQLTGTDDNSLAGAGMPEEAVYHLNQIAVLYRSHHLAKPLIDKLKTSGLPYQVVSNQIQPDAQIERLLSVWQDWLPEMTNLTQLKQVFEFWQIRGQLSLPEHIRQYLSQLSQINAQLDWPDMLQLIHQELQLLSNQPLVPESDKLRLMTIHAAKGLEFEVVFLLMPQPPFLPYELKEPVDYQAEKRLMFVAISRSQAKLYLEVVSQARVWGKQWPTQPDYWKKYFPQLSSLPVPQGKPRQPRLLF